MADIKVEKKGNNSPIWPWIVGILVLAGIIWWIAADDEKPITAYDAPETTAIQEERVSDQYVGEESEVNSEAVMRSYIDFVEDRFEGADFNLNHEYTREGILKLQNALAVLAREKTDLGTIVRDEMEKLEAISTELGTDPQNLRHAELTQQAFMTSARIMQVIQENEDDDESYRDTVALVMAAANDINAKQNLLDQKDKVREFFIVASEAIERMSDELEGTATSVGGV